MCHRSVRFLIPSKVCGCPLSSARMAPNRWVLPRALAAFNVESLFARKRATRAPHTVFVNRALPDHLFDHRRRPVKAHISPTNQVISSKYTIVTFLPRNLLEQFRRIANMYVPPFPLSPVLTLLQLLPLHRHPPVLPRVLHHLSRPRPPPHHHRPRHYCHQGRLRRH